MAHGDVKKQPTFRRSGIYCGLPGKRPKEVLRVVNIVLQELGDIPKGSAKDILSIVHECYERLQPHGVDILDILLFSNPSKMNAFYSGERSTMHVASEDFGESFVAMHDAWRGTPRIGVCMSRMKDLPPLIQTGTLRHEVGHSVLHGSMEYYVFPIGVRLTQAAQKLGLTKEYSFNLLYLISIAVKDFEVTRLLSGKGYVEDQLAYSNHVLRTSKEDLSAWQLSKGDPARMALCLAARLKDTACLVALQPKIGEPLVVDRIKDELSYLQDPILNETLKTLKRFPQATVGDTFQNVAAMTKTFVEDLLQPLFIQP